MIKLTGILSLLLLLEVTSRLEATETSHDHNRASHHNYHHSRHRFHSNANALANQSADRRGKTYRSVHESPRNSRTPEEHRHLHESRDEPNATARDAAKVVDQVAGSRGAAYGYSSDQRFRSRDGFNGFPLTTLTPLYTKHHAGRRVCSRQSPTSINHHTGSQIRFTYTEVSTSSFLCCPGWSQMTPTSYGCNRPTCVAPCYNGGICGTHGKCNCPKGFTGTQCQTDIDECLTEKPCAQICTNSPGSYECHCRYGFQLQPDGQSCRKNDSDGTAFEARDLENDYGITTSTRRPGDVKPHDTENEVGDGELERDYDSILKRLSKLEKQFARDRRRETETVQLNTKIDQAVEGVAELRLAAKNALHFLLETFGPVRQDVSSLKSKFEAEHRRVDYVIQRVAELDHRLNGQRPATNG